MHAGLTNELDKTKLCEVFMHAVMTAEQTRFAQTYTLDDDLALVHASRNGDCTAFSELVKRYDRKLLRIALHVTHNLEDAEEAVQEAFFKAYQKLDQFQGYARFSTWLVRIALNESFTKLRKQRAVEQSIDSETYADSDTLVFDLADWAPNPEALYSTAEFREILTNSLQRLSPALKAVFVLRDIQEYSLKEASEILHLTETAVKTRLRRARLQLREQLSRYFRKPQ